MKQKFLTLTCALCALVLIVSRSYARENQLMATTPVPFAVSNFEGQGTSGTGSAVSATINGVTVSCDKAYGASESLRCYSGAVLTVYSATRVINKISFEFSNTKYTGGLANEVEINSTIWSYSISGSQARITSMVVTLEESASGEGSEVISIILTMPTTFSWTPYIYAWDNEDNALIGAWPGTKMTSIGNRQYVYMFDASVTSANIIFNGGSANSYQTADILGVTASACYKLDGNFVETSKLNYKQQDCSNLDGEVEMDKAIIRLNPYSLTWDAAYLYAWTGATSYSNSSSTKLVAAQKMTLAEDGWWTYEVSFEKGTSFYVGFDSQSDNSPLYYINSSAFTGSTCFEYNSSLVTTSYVNLAPNESNSYTVHVATAGTFGQMMVQKLGDATWTDIVGLTITGSLNEDDFTYFNRMTNLQELDMSGTDIATFGGCKDLDHITKVVLPSSCKTINNNAFYGCKRMRSINLENVETIGEYAFYKCVALAVLNLPQVRSVGYAAFAYETSTSSYSSTALTSVSMPLVQTIGNYAFAGNRMLSSVTMPMVTSIGNYAFQNCYSIEQVNIPNAISLGQRAFYMYKTSSVSSQLDQVTLSDELQSIPEECFYNCALLNSIQLPSALTSIGNYALNTITDVQLPDNLISVGSGNFSNATSITIPAKVTSWSSFSDTWKHVYCHVIVPPVFSVFNKDNVADDTLHVPSISLAAYKLHSNWYKFGHIEAMTEAVSDITINSEFMLLSTTGIANKADITINAGGALAMSAENALAAGSYVQQVGCTPVQYSSNSQYDNNGNYTTVYSTSIPYTGILHANSAVTADEVTVRLVPRSGQWNFFSLPFDVNMSDISVQTQGSGKVGISQWVIREYSGANRASGNGSTWNNVPSDGVLKAHTGYILYWLVENSGSYDNNRTSSYYNFLYYFNMPAVKNANQQHIFATGDVNVPLVEYSAEFPQNRSWNLVGNPYPCAYDIRQMEFGAPITTWNGSSYVAYSLEDDSYILRPAEAFFVQAPQGTTQIGFPKEGRFSTNYREITQEEYNNRRSAPAMRQATRKVFNFILSNEDYSDRARLVLNDQASAEYEITRDAAKMMSSDMSVPQLFVNDNGLRYAIDERPEASSYVLGAFFGKTGDYTLHLNLPQSEERQVLLTDTETHISTDLTLGDYLFTTEAGTYDSRFIITFAPKVPTGIDEVQGDNVPCTKVLHNGQLIIVNPQGKKFTVGGTEL